MGGAAQTALAETAPGSSWACKLENQVRRRSGSFCITARAFPSLPGSSLRYRGQLLPPPEFPVIGGQSRHVKSNSKGETSAWQEASLSCCRLGCCMDICGEGGAVGPGVLCLGVRLRGRIKTSRATALSNPSSCTSAAYFWSCEACAELPWGTREWDQGAFPWTCLKSCIHLPWPICWRSHNNLPAQD